MPYATPLDVANELGRPLPDDPEVTQWVGWIARVERKLERLFQRSGYDLATQIAAGSPTEDEVVDLVVTRVAAKVLNPTGLTSVTRSIDDASVTTRREGSAVVSGDPLDIDADDITDLLPTGRRRVRAYSVSPS